MTFIRFALLLALATPARGSDAIRVGTTQDVTSFDWNKSVDAPSSWILSHLTRRLFHVDAGGDVVFDLAESESTKGLETRIQVRANIKWSDGRALVAQDFVDSIERVKGPVTASPAAPYILDLASVRADGPRDLVLTWKKPRADVRGLLSHTAFAPIRRDLVAKWGQDWATPEHWVGLGPYLLAGYKLDQKISLSPLANRFVKPIEVRIVSETTTLDSLFTAGEIDVAVGTTPPRIDAESKDEKAHSLDRVSALVINEKAISPELRAAIAAAVDRSPLLKALGPGPVAQTTWIPSSPSIKVEGARAKVGGKFKLTFSNRDDHRLAAQVLQSQLKETGLAIELEGIDLKIFLQRLKAGDVQLALVSFGSGIPDPAAWFTPFKGDGSYGALLSDAKFEAQVAKIESEADRSRRKTIVREAEEELVSKRKCVVPLYREAKWVRTKPHVFNVEFINGQLRMERLRVSEKDSATAH